MVLVVIQKKTLSLSARGMYGTTKSPLEFEGFEGNVALHTSGPNPPGIHSGQQR
jgi:hypothetical protein